MQSVQRELAEKPDPARAEQLRKQQRNLQKDISRYQLHLAQYEVCRKKVTEFENSLRYKDGRCLLLRDFVNQYNEEGGHVKNLNFVKIARAGWTAARAKDQQLLLG